jgi:hypothetical protein
VEGSLFKASPDKKLVRPPSLNKVGMVLYSEIPAMQEAVGRRTVVPYFSGQKHEALFEKYLKLKRAG